MTIPDQYRKRLEDEAEKHYYEADSILCVKCGAHVADRAQECEGYLAGAEAAWVLAQIEAYESVLGLFFVHQVEGARSVADAIAERLRRLREMGAGHE